MRRIYLTILSTLFCIVVTAQNLIQIHDSNENHIFLLKEISRISHEISGKMSISTANQDWNYDVETISRVNIGFNEYGFCQIPSDKLDGWDAGVILSSDYFVLRKINQETNQSYCYIGKLYSSEVGLLFYFNSQNEITCVSSLNGVLNISKDENGNSLMYLIDKDGAISSLDEMSENASNARSLYKQASRSIVGDIFEAITGLDVASTWYGRYNTFRDLISGNWGGAAIGIFSDIAGTLFGNITGPIGGLLVGGCFDRLDNARKDLEDKSVKMLLGDASAEITEIKRTGFKSYSFTVDVKKLETRPYGKVMNKQTDVKVGLFLRETFSTVNRDYNSLTTEFQQISENGKLTFDVNSLNVGSTYYVVPAIIPVYKTYEHKNNTRYGKTKSFIITRPSATIKKVENVKEKSADIICEFTDMWPEVSCGIRLLQDVLSGESSTGPTLTFGGTSANGEQKISASGLTAYTSYSCNAYVQYDGNTDYVGYKGFRTAFPDISGTWTCKETHYDYAGNVSYTTYTIDLNSDGTATINKPGFNYINATWSGGPSISIQANTIATQNLSQGFVWNGNVNNPQNPTKYSGGYTYMWNYNNIGYFQGDGTPIELTR